MKRILIAAVAALVLGAPAFAADWPTKPVKVVVPWTPGGTGDNNARPYADELSRLLGQPFVVENRGGAGGSVGTEAVAKSAPDGYTILMTPMSPLLLRPALYKNVPYDTFKDFEPVSQMSESVAVLGASPKLGVKSLKELIDLAKKKPGEIFFGSAGIGSITQIRVEHLKQLAGIDMVHVPYNGSGPAMTDLLAGHIQLLFEPIVGPQVKSGALVGIGVLDVKRDPTMPDVPTMDEAAKAAGLGGFSTPGWQGCWAPKGTPKDIVKKLSEAIAKVGATPEMEKRLRLSSLRPQTSTPEEMAVIMRRDYDFFQKLIPAAGIKAE